MERFLSILEVSQKQAYIFASNKVKDNITNSAVISYALSPEFIAELLKETKYSDEKNMVYSGGGHTILEFEDEESAKEAVMIITEAAYRQFNGLNVFAKTIPYCASTPKENLVELTKQLERKKALREAAFKQGSYGIEKIDSNTLNVTLSSKQISENEKIGDRERKESAKNYIPQGYKSVEKFELLGGSKGDSNFISVVHIDGNGMGARTEELYEKLQGLSWEETKQELRKYSESIDQDFKNAYKHMTEYVAKNLENEAFAKKLSLKDNNFPVRRIITAGDDICFVAEGRIGIECARAFIEYLGQEKNKADGKGYAACAGVAIVHQKYPFYKAYELAEILCSNAKKYGASISPDDNGRSVSAIDWHIEFGELKDSLDEIREVYQTLDGNRLELRPYIVQAPEQIMNDEQLIAKKYSNFRRIIDSIMSKENTYGQGKIKGLRSAMKAGETATTNYLRFNRMEDIAVENRPHGEKIDLMQLFSGKKISVESFIELKNKKHSILFDAIELMDTYLSLEGDTAK